MRPRHRRLSVDGVAALDAKMIELVRAVELRRARSRAAPAGYWSGDYRTAGFIDGDNVGAEDSRDSSGR